MSFLPDLTPLISEIKQFNSTQALILAELKEIRQLLKHAITSKEAK
jgi:hypothetical protein